MGAIPTRPFRLYRTRLDGRRRRGRRRRHRVSELAIDLRELARDPLPLLLRALEALRLLEQLALAEFEQIPALRPDLARERRRHVAEPFRHRNRMLAVLAGKLP